jgi:hypothetical protein
MAEVGRTNIANLPSHGTVTITGVASPGQQNFGSVVQMQTADVFVNTDNKQLWKLIRRLLLCLLLLG